MKKISFMIILFFSLTISLVFSQIDSQWRGPNRDGIYPEKNLLKKWPAEGPKLLWSVNGLGEGYSSAAVTSDRIYLTGMTGGAGHKIRVEVGTVWIGRRAKFSFLPEKLEIKET